MNNAGHARIWPESSWIFGRIPGRIPAREHWLDFQFSQGNPAANPARSQIRPYLFQPKIFFSPFESRIRPKSVKTSTKFIKQEIT